MTCPNCTKDSKCATCEIKDMGFVQKSDIEGMLKNVHHAEPVGTDTKNQHFTGDIDALFNHVNTCPDPANCKISKKINSLFEDAYAQGLRTGLL